MAKKLPVVNIVAQDLGDHLKGRAVAVPVEPVSRLDGFATSIAIAESFGEYASRCFADPLLRCAEWYREHGPK